MASRILLKSVSSAIKAHNAYLRSSLFRSRAISASAPFSSCSSPSSFIFRPNSFIGVSRNSQLLSLSSHYSFHRRFSDSAPQDNQDGFTDRAYNGIAEAYLVAHFSNQLCVESEHVMKALLEQNDGPARQIFAKAGVDNSFALKATEDFISTQAKETDDTSGSSIFKNWFGAQSQPKVTDNGLMIVGSSYRTILLFADRKRREFKEDYVSVEHLLLAFYSDERFGQEFFNTLKLNKEALMDVIKADRVSQQVTDQSKYCVAWALNVLHFVDDVLSCGKSENMLLEGDDIKDLTVKRMMVFQAGKSKATDVDPKGNYKALEKYGNDLTEMARQGKLDPVIGRDDEIRRCLQILCRRTKSNPVIVGEPGVGKTSIAEGLAQRIIQGDVPEPLLNRKLISLDMGSLVAGTPYRGDFEKKLKAVLEDVIASNGQTILFIDEIHTLVGAGALRGAMDASNLLKPMLGRGELRCIGATTLTEYRKYIEKDPALERRFHRVFCNQPSVEDTISILRGLRKTYELHHGVKISDGSLVSAAVLSDRYITERFLPDKAIDLVDEAASKLKMEIASKPTELDEIDRAVIKLKMQKRSLEDDTDKASKERLQNIENDLSTLRHKQKELSDQWEKEKSVMTKIRSVKEEIDRVNLEIISAERESDQNRAPELKYETVTSLQRQLEESEQSLVREELTDRDIAATVSEWTGIPLCNLQQSEREKLVRLEEVLHERIVGQDMAVESVADAVRFSKAGLSDPNRPIASLMFMGPTGVGKTELAKALAGYLFDTEDAIVRIDMSEYIGKNSVSRLIGTPPGYVGYEDCGQLTEAVRRRPYSVVLFDEIEKAHPDVFSILLQLLDDGRITDSHGRTVKFSNCFIIMTSNIGSHQILETIRNNKDSKEAVYEMMKQQVVGLARQTFRPEFINRIDEYIVFKPLDSTEISKIVEFQMRRVKKRMEQNKISLEYTKEAVDLIAQLGFDPKNGARPVKRMIEKIVKKDITLKLLKGEFAEEDTILLDVGQPDNELVIKKLENNAHVEEMAA